MIKNPLVEKIDEYGEVTITETDAIDAMLSGISINNVHISDDTAYSKYALSVSKIDGNEFPNIKPSQTKDMDADKHLYRRSMKWFLPSEYVYMDIEEFLLSKCTTDAETERVVNELKEFNRRNETDVLRVMKYIVDKFRENNVVWGVGRGSSVSCYCLYLIGINKINPLLYGIPYTEYFKEM